jgi:hypothetical protein
MTTQSRPAWTGSFLLFGFVLKYSNQWLKKAALNRESIPSSSNALGEQSVEMFLTLSPVTKGWLWL